MNSSTATTTTTTQNSGLCLLAWKRRSGLLGHKLFLNKKNWEERWVVVAGNQLQYYRLGDEGTPRGVIDVTQGKTSVHVTTTTTTATASDAPPTPHAVDIEHILPKNTMESPKNEQDHHDENGGGMDGTASSHTRHSSSTTKIQWQLCFREQQELMNFLSAVHTMLESAHQFETLDGDRFEHDFRRGDHIFRWEMIVCPPVIYPIQIHGIVLTAGRNCVVVADFGLTGYGRRHEGDDFNFSSEHNTSNVVWEAWKKLRPTESDQRLNITTLTEPLDMRKWTRANYDDDSFLFGSSSSSSSPASQGGASSLVHLPKLTKLKQFVVSTLTGTGNSNSSNNDDEEDHSKTHHRGDDDKDDTIQQVPSADSTNSTSKEQQQQQPEPLPTSDPTDIVLARANFLLEHADELPPYHVFYSNSECMAVWCKTGRWSTLQTAVFLSTTSVGAAKSSTVATLGMVATAPLLAPVVAIGGLVWVSAPMVMLKKSREKWQEATMQMTRLFWEWAPNAIIVAAVEHWSAVGLLGGSYTTTTTTDTKNNDHQASVEKKKIRASGDG